MSTHPQGVEVALPADVHMVDETGYVWSVLEESEHPERVKPGHVIVAGDAEEPFLARVVDIVAGAEGTHIVHLDVVGVPDQLVDELRRSRLLAS